MDRAACFTPFQKTVDLIGISPAGHRRPLDASLCLTDLYQNCIACELEGFARTHKTLDLTSAECS